MIVYVIGSGPSGVSVSSALLAKGHQVVMLDYGNEINQEKQRQVQQIAATEIKDWNEDLLKSIKPAIDKNIPHKLLYGEDFIYKDGLGSLEISLINCGLLPSLAKGGLSNVWGAAVLPFVNKDLDNWPISVEDLAPHYALVTKFMPIAANIDSLSGEYPLYGNYSAHKISPQINQFYKTFTQDSTFLQQQDIQCGYSRLSYISNKCNGCSLCMRGCPYDLIYNSKHTLSQLMGNKNFSYISGVLVEKFEEVLCLNEYKVKIFVKLRNNEGQEFVADKLFLGGGVLSTAKLVLTSLQKKHSITIKETPYFIAPFFVWNRTFALDYQTATLAQLFIEINDRQISKHTVHLQVYPYNEMLLERIKNMLGYLYYLFVPLIKFILSKTIIIQGFFHSAEGEDMIAYLEDNKLKVQGNNHKINDKMKLIFKKFKRFGFFYGVQKALPGRSFHCGGAFPMVEHPEKSDKLTVDIKGLLKGTKNVHIIDASILPTIPAQTITYTVMANAHRIGSLF